jgi:hypothetical protein
MVLSLAFAIELCKWDAASFIREVDVESVMIVGKYSTKTKKVRS